MPNISSKKLFGSKNELEELVNTWRNDACRIVFTSGVFDITHIGHFRTLEIAKSHGNKLIVAINSDDSVKRKKGNLRPINNQQHRSALLTHLQHVDAVYVFDEANNQPLSLIKLLKPDVVVKSSGEWKEKENAFEDVVSDWAGEVKIIQHDFDISTTKIINKITSLYC